MQPPPPPHRATVSLQTFGSDQISACTKHCAIDHETGLKQLEICIYIVTMETEIYEY